MERPEDQLSECPRCKSSFAGHDLSAMRYCPQCGVVLESQSAEFTGVRVEALLSRYWSDLWMILSQPSRFFRKMPRSGGVAGPLAFALVNHWLGSALGFLWQLVLGAGIVKYLSYFIQVMGDVVDVDYPGRGSELLVLSDRFMSWFMSVGPIVIDPFTTLIGLFYTGFLVYLGTRLLVPLRSAQVTFNTALRLVCFGMAPSVLSAVPIIGGFLSSFGIVLVTVVGAREVYRVGTGRAVLIALFPRLLLVVAVGVGILSVLIFFFQIFVSVFH